MHTDDNQILLIPQKYATDLSTKTNMLTANTVPTSMISSIKLSKDNSDLYDDPKQYRFIVGALQYLTLTRLDITFAVSKMQIGVLMYVDDRRSMTGYCVYFGRNLIAWKCNKQQAVSRSSTEAEFRALVAVQSKLVWTQNLPLQENH
ncbi:uncharacterized protein LOC107636185 [Arachis ipaensis]|uniref:uncharacterized protein LOC107636185 n=1 Tax=Arachis ipaensis TaxID=130454 RepID=UPI0007AEF20D|nr:uncharacterized protein LOC107636185 [Arachis ipaensis]